MKSGPTSRGLLGSSSQTAEEDNNFSDDGKLIRALGKVARREAEQAERNIDATES